MQDRTQGMARVDDFNLEELRKALRKTINEVRTFEFSSSSVTYLL